MTSALYDKKALKILSDTYWSSTGWKKDRTILPEDFAYAKAKGLMFESRILHHDKMVVDARAQAEEIGEEVVAKAFLASLSSRELAYRSALGSFATSRWLPKHSHEPQRFSYSCHVCGDSFENTDQDLSVLNFERLKWGGVRHLTPYYAWFDLCEFRKLPASSPSLIDRDTLKRILSIAASQPASARPGDLEKAIAGLFPSSKHERRNVLQILGYCGILQPSKHQSFFQSYARMDDRAEPLEMKNDWSFPFLWWRGSDGVNAKALKFYFPDLR